MGGDFIVFGVDSEIFVVLDAPGRLRRWLDHQIEGNKPLPDPHEVPICADSRLELSLLPENYAPKSVSSCWSEHSMARPPRCAQQQSPLESYSEFRS